MRFSGGDAPGVEIRTIAQTPAAGQQLMEK
jgi:hypothetical protein